ncbi:HIT family protein [Catenovulum agarivorans]|uniref:HIT family protein n=1 Tax=Catenovulum agarivorans TaxID=1172192 RepID=UPI0002E58AE9|nr:HIT domain-containing protein [Catenovulum agarivorans]
MNKQCKFCGYMNSSSVSTRAIDRPWFEDDKFAAFITQGALTKGWTVIFPKEHVPNMSSYYLDSDFWAFVKTVHLKLVKVFGECVYFEHGASSEGSITGCGVDHAHIHIVPLKFDLKRAVESFDPEINWEKCKSSSLHKLTCEYLSFSNDVPNQDSLVYVSKLEQPTSQFFRKVIAAGLGIPHLYNYRIDQFLDNASESLALLADKENTCANYI